MVKIYLITGCFVVIYPIFSEIAELPDWVGVRISMFYIYFSLLVTISILIISLFLKPNNLLGVSSKLFVLASWCILCLGGLTYLILFTHYCESDCSSERWDYDKTVILPTTYIVIINTIVIYLNSKIHFKHELFNRA